MDPLTQASREPQTFNLQDVKQPPLLFITYVDIPGVFKYSKETRIRQSKRLTLKKNMNRSQIPKKKNKRSKDRDYESGTSWSSSKMVYGI